MKKILLFLMLAMFCIPWAVNAQDELTVYSGTNTSSYVPVYGLYTDTQGAASEFVIPSDSLEDMVGGTITQLTFYLGTPAAAAWTGTLQVYLGEVEATTLSGITGPSAHSVVYTGLLDATGSVMTVTFSEPYIYGGGNLLIGSYVSVAGNWKSASFNGITQTENTGWYRSSASATGSAAKFIPKTTFTYTPGNVTCAKPELESPNISAYGCNIGIIGGSGTFNVEYKVSTDTGWTVFATVEELSMIVLEGLTPATTYQVRIQSVCGEDPETGEPVVSGWKSTSFTTPCAALNSYPWGTNLDNFTGSTSGGTNNLPMCWNYINTSTNSTYKGYPIVYNSSTYAHSGTNSLRFYSYTTTASSSTYDPQDQYAILPEMEELNGKILSLSARGYNANSTFKVGLMSDPTDVNTFQEIANQEGLTTSYQDFNYILEGGGNYVAIMIEAANAERTINGVYIDDIAITTCPKPTALAATHVTGNSAELSWTAIGGESAWTLYYKKGADTAYTSVEVTENPYTLEGLDASSSYVFYVIANCSAEEFSAASAECSFATECDIIATYPWAENFDSYSGVTAGTTNNLPICWNYINTCSTSTYKGYPVIYNGSSYSHSGNNHLRFYTYYTSTSDPQDQYAILPAMADLNGRQLTLYARGANANSSFKVGLMTNPADASTFQEIATTTPATSYDEYAYILEGEGEYVAIMVEAAVSDATSRTIYIDDIAIASCPKPTAPTATHVTGNSAELNWTANGGENTWTLYYKKGTDTAYTSVEVTEKPYTLEGLDASSSYVFYVVANCSAEDLSAASAEYSFATECEAISTLPWDENFDSYSTNATSSTAPTGYPDHEMPACWQILNLSGTTSTYPQAFITAYSSYAVSGKCLFFKSSNTTPIYAVLPEFAENISGLQLTFTYRNEGVSTYNGTLLVGYMTDPTDANTFTAVHTCTQITTLTEQEVLFPDAPAGSYIAFKYQGGTNNNYYLSIDNVNVNYAPTCEKPTGLAVSEVTAHTAKLTWTSEASSWQICLNDNEEDIIEVNENPYILEGLDASTSYTVKVRANCGNAGLSYWTSNKSFTTTIACPVPTSLTATELTAHSAKLGWTENGQASEWIVRYKTNAATDTIYTEINVVDTNTYTMVTGLEPSTTYTFNVKAVCGGIDGESNWSAAKTFTTTGACPVPTDLVCESVTTTTATLSWFGGENDMWELLVLQGSDTINDFIVEPEPSYTVEGLQPGTTYTFKVRTTCDTTETWSTSKSFLTGFTVPLIEPFNTSTIPAGWSRYNGLLSGVMAGTTELTSISSIWSFGAGSNGVFDSHAYINIYGTDRHHWLVTPSVLMDENVQLTFDLALTKYSGTLQPVVDTLQQDDKFVVLITTNNGTSWEVLRQWDNAGSEYVYNNIVCSAVGEEVAIDLSNYAGQNIAIAFYGESTVSGGDNNLHIDNVKINYIPTCPKPTNLTVSNIQPHVATFDWESGEVNGWEVRIDGNDTTFITTEHPYTLEYPILTAGATHTVEVRAICDQNLYPFAEHTDVSEWSALVTFTTPCEAVTEFPWTDDFEEYSTGNFTTPCWQNEHIEGGGTQIFKIAAGSSYSTGNNTSHVLQLPDMAAGTMTKLVLPYMTLPSDNYQFTLDVYRSSNTYQSNPYELEGIRVFASTNGEIEGATELAFIPRHYQVGNEVINAEDSVGWYTYQLPIGISGDCYIILRGESQYCTSTYMDNFVVEEMPVTTVEQTIQLITGTNWVSFYVETNLADLKAALVAAAPAGSSIKIGGQTSSTSYTRGRWLGDLAWDLSKMYKIEVTADCEITLEGMPINPADHPVTLLNGNNYLGFPFNQEMTLLTAFAGFAVNSDKVSGHTVNATYTRGRWNGSFSALQPGKGYIYNSAASEDRTFVFPVSSR